MWAAGLFDKLPWPDRQTDTGQIVEVFPGIDRSPWRFIVDLELRAKPEILDASDLIYRLHWATTHMWKESLLQVALNRTSFTSGTMP